MDEWQQVKEVLQMCETKRLHYLSDILRSFFMQLAKSNVVLECLTEEEESFIFKHFNQDLIDTRPGSACSLLTSPSGLQAVFLSLIRRTKD